MGGADAIIFGGGIGEHSAEIRARICSGFGWCGITFDDQSNRSVSGTEALLSTPRSSVALHVIPVDEEMLIAQETLRCLAIS